MSQEIFFETLDEFLNRARCGDEKEFDGKLINMYTNEFVVINFLRYERKKKRERKRKLD